MDAHAFLLMVSSACSVLVATTFSLESPHLCVQPDSGQWDTIGKSHHNTQVLVWTMYMFLIVIFLFLYSWITPNLEQDHLSYPRQLCDKFNFISKFSSTQGKTMEYLKASVPQTVFTRRLVSFYGKELPLLSCAFFL